MSPAWEDWHRHVEAITELLDESSERLLRAVGVYVESEAARANRMTAVRSAGVDW